MNVHPDVEHLIVDVVTAIKAPYAPTMTVSVGVPNSWGPTKPPHCSVAVDSSTEVASAWSGDPVAARCLVRFTVRAASTTEAKRLANIVLSLVKRHDGTGGVRFLSGGAAVVADRDPDSRAELAGFAARAIARSVEL